jgi:hypothetical protein
MMLDKMVALDYASKALSEKAPAGESWVIVDDNTTETQSAWIFFYNTQRSIESGSAIHKLAGNGPIFVNKMTGEVEFFGSTPPLEEIAEQYEARLRGSGHACNEKY